MPVKWQSLTLFLSLSWFITSGQVRFDHFTTDQGLSQNTILSIIQDRTGYLWIGTEDGLNRFDGYTFKKYHTVLGDSLNLPDDQIWSLLEDSQGRIWIGHSRGISYFDFLDHKFHTVLLEDNMIVSTSFQDTNGNLWFGTSGSGLIRVDKNNFKITRFRNPESPLAPYDQQAWSLVSNYIISISENSAGLLIGTRGAGLFQFQNEKFFRPDFQEAYENFFMQNDVWSIIKNTRGEFCFGTTKGLGVFQDDLRSGKLYQANDKSNSPASNRIARLCLDSRSGLWVATYGDGLKYFDFNSEKFTHFRKTVEPHSLSNNLVFTLLMDREKNVWIGTWTGGLNKLNRSARYISSYSTGSGLGDNYVPSISARGDSVFVATYSSGIYLMIENDTNKSVFIPIKDKDTLQPNYIRSIFAGSKLWVGLDGGGVAFTDYDFKGKWGYYRKISENENSLNNHLVNVVYEDAYSTLWVGTLKSGLKRIYPHVEYGAPGSIQHFNSIPGDSSSLSDDVITGVFIDSLQFLWVGTRNGLNRSATPVHRDRVINEFVRYGGGAITSIAYGQQSLWVGTENGLYKLVNRKLLPMRELIDHFINAILFDEKSVAWVSTNRGIASVHPAGRVAWFTRADGLQGNEFNLGAASTSSTGRFFFGGVNGLSRFYPGDLDFEKITPSIAVTRIILNNDNEISGKPATLSMQPEDKIIEFEFSILDYSNPTLNTYQYKLEGFDDAWISTSANERTATYTNLSPGNYIFKVRGSDSEGILSKEEAIAFTVEPPLWRTWWAYGMYIFFLITIIFGARKNIVNRERLKAKLKLEHLELDKLKELDEFKSKFFANISHEFRTPLTLIQGHAETLKSNTQIDKAISSIQTNSQALLGLVNQMLDLSRIDAGKLQLNKTRIDLNAFLNIHVQAFHSLAQQRHIILLDSYPSGFATVILDSSILEKIINNLLTNAIKYSVEGSKVLFTARLNEEVLEIIVSDTGIGIKEEDIGKIFDRFYRVSENTEGTGIGLALTQELVKMHEGTISVSSKLGEGSVFTVRIPVGIESISSVTESSIASHSGSVNSIEWPELRVNDSTLPHVLVVEDNEELRKFLRQNLDEFEISLCANAEDGVRYAIQYVPDIVVTDWMMPGMSGIELCKRLKSTEVTSHIPVVMLTAKAELETKLEGLETGADDYLTKPFEMKELKVRLRNLISQRHLLREKFSKGLAIYKHVKASSVDDKFIEKFYRFLEAHISNSALTVESLSLEMGVSRVQLHRKLSALFGHSASDLIRDYRLERAGDLLRQKAGNVSEIAFQVGFENLSYFTKAFKQKFEVTPSEYFDS